MSEVNPTMTSQEEARAVRFALYRQTANDLVDALVGVLTERDQVHPEDLLIERNSTIKYGTRTRPVYSVLTPAGGPRVRFYFRDTKNPSRPLDLIACELLCPSLGVVQEFKPRKNQLDLLTIATRLIQVWQEFKVKRQQAIDEQEEAKRQENERAAQRLRHRQAGAQLLEKLAEVMGIDAWQLERLPRQYRCHNYLPGLYIRHHELPNPPEGHVELVDITVELSSGSSAGIPLKNLSRALAQLTEQLPQDLALQVWGGGSVLGLSGTLTYADALVVLPILRAALLPLGEFLSKN